MELSSSIKCNKTEINKNRQHSQMNLDDLDKALHDLGMLNAITEARRDYIRESKSNLSVMRLNTRYVSNVTVGYCMKRTAVKNRLCPYVLPLRHRTKSENSDSVATDVKECSSESKCSIYEPSTSKELLDVKSPTKRCQSLENLNVSLDPPTAEISPEMDCVSTRIQKLHVDE